DHSLLFEFPVHLAVLFWMVPGKTSFLQLIEFSLFRRIGHAVLIACGQCFRKFSSKGALYRAQLNNTVDMVPMLNGVQNYYFPQVRKADEVRFIDVEMGANCFQIIDILL